LPCAFVLLADAVLLWEEHAETDAQHLVEVKLTVRSGDLAVRKVTRVPIGFASYVEAAGIPLEGKTAPLCANSRPAIREEGKAETKGRSNCRAIDLLKGALRDALLAIGSF